MIVKSSTHTLVKCMIKFGPLLTIRHLWSTLKPPRLLVCLQELTGFNVFKEILNAQRLLLYVISFKIQLKEEKRTSSVVAVEVE